VKNILVLFDQEWDTLQLARIANITDAQYQFFHEGFDLFSFPSNANLLFFDIFKFVDKLVEKYKRIKIDGIVTSHEQFGALSAALLADRLGLPAMSAQAVMNAQHKALARTLLQTHAPHTTIPFAVFPYTVKSAAEIDLAFPFYTKPVKAAYSVLARRVDDFTQLKKHLSFHPWEKYIIKRLVRPFNDVVQHMEASTVDGHWMMAEALIDGFQVNVDGFIEDSEVKILGIVDAVMYPGTDAFLRWEYPSRLPPEWQENIRRATKDVVKALSLDHGLFNVEIRICSHSGECKVIEVNPRMAMQFSDMYEAVNGVNLHVLAIKLAQGLPSGIGNIVSTDGQAKVATSFVYRRFDGKAQTHFPNSSQIAALQAFDPRAQLITFKKSGGELKRESKWLQSYRYACLNMSADSVEALTEKYHRASAILGFPTHP
jgi:ATP-grasp domain